MFETYEKLPEWVRWLLLIPLFFGIMFAFSLLFHRMSLHLAGIFFYDRIFAPFMGGLLLVYVATRLLPRAKLIIAYLLCFFWVPLVALGILSFANLAPSDGLFTVNDLFQGSSALLGSLVATIQARKKYRWR